MPKCIEKDQEPLFIKFKLIVSRCIYRKHRNCIIFYTSKVLPISVIVPPTVQNKV